MADMTLKGMMTEEEFIQHTANREEMSDEDFLEHYGKKGMKWGQRAAEYNSGVYAKSRNVRKAGVDGKQSKDDRNSAIDAARGRIATGSNKKDYKEAKANLKANRKTEGKAAAKAALRAVKDKNADDYHDSQLAKSGGEKVRATVAVVATLALYAGYVAVSARS